MSIMIMSRVFRMNLGGCNRKLLAVRLADFADDEGRGIYPGVKRLAAETELSERTIQRILADFVEEGILTVVQEASGRPGQTNRYDYNLKTLFAYQPRKTGDTLSPVSTDGGVTNQPETGDTSDGEGCHGVTRTVKEPLTEPLTERDACESVSQGEDGTVSDQVETPSSVERNFRKFFFGWKTNLSDSEVEARKEWLAFTSQERSEALERSQDYQTEALTTGRKYLCSAAKYLSERRWTKLAPPSSTCGGSVPAKPYTRPWAAFHFAELLKPAAKLTPFPPFVQKMIDDGKLDRDAQIRDRLMQQGWPSVVDMHRRVAEFKGVLVPSAIAALGETFTSVRIGSAEHEAWKRLHADRCWPFLPDPEKNLEFLQLPAIPAGAPADVDGAVAAALSAFERSLKGVRGDEHAA